MSLNWHFPWYILLVLSVLTLGAADVFQISLFNGDQMAFFDEFLEFISWTISNLVGQIVLIIQLGLFFF